MLDSHPLYCTRFNIVVKMVAGVKKKILSYRKNGGQVEE